MVTMTTRPPARRRWGPAALAGVLALAGLALPTVASALPLFARQTGQNCVACHAGGQFPELTAYGRLFKLTGYTMGERTSVPLSVMAVASVSKVGNTTRGADPAADFPKNDQLIVPTASLFTGGRISDNLGAFVQVTYDRYALQAADGSFRGHSNADNIELRYADRWITPERDLIAGVSVNNNPSVSDPWNSAPAWMQYVPVPSPGSSAFIDGAAPYPGYAAGGNIAGISAYALWNQSVYAELGGYGSARGIFSVMRAGVADADTTRLRGLNPYLRLAYTRSWGAHNLMVGASGMVARIYDDPTDVGDPATVHRDRDLGVDAQYQYQLDPHSVTVQAAYMVNRHRYSAADPLAGLADRTHVFRAKGTYVYRAKVGGSLSWFEQAGRLADPAGAVGTRGATAEVFWLPIQYLRLGLQYTAYSRFEGASQNYNGLGRNASDNNSLFLYAWMAY